MLPVFFNLFELYNESYPKAEISAEMVRVIHFWFTRISYVVCIKNLFSDTLAMGKELEALQNAKN